jgi:hypothetical protein
LELASSEDDPDVRRNYRAFLLDNTTDDWANGLGLETIREMAE